MYMWLLFHCWIIHLPFFRCRDYTEKNKATNYHVRKLFVIIAIVIAIVIKRHIVSSIIDRGTRLLHFYILIFSWEPWRPKSVNWNRNWSTARGVNRQDRKMRGEVLMVRTIMQNTHPRTQLSIHFCQHGSDKQYPQTHHVECVDRTIISRCL